MRRDHRLRPLSSEHHRALVIARDAIRAAQLAREEELSTAWSVARSAMARELEPHFVEEESCLLPALDAAGEKHLVARTLSEHAELRRLIAPGTSAREALGAWGLLLRSHVQFEETELFPAAERTLSSEVLDWVGAHRSGVSEKPA